MTFTGISMPWHGESEGKAHAERGAIRQTLLVAARRRCRPEGLARL
jgi:hypothetical protein